MNDDIVDELSDEVAEEHLCVRTQGCVDGLAEQNDAEKDGCQQGKYIVQDFLATTDQVTIDNVNCQNGDDANNDAGDAVVHERNHVGAGVFPDCTTVANDVANDADGCRNDHSQAGTDQEDGNAREDDGVHACWFGCCSLLCKNESQNDHLDVCGYTIISLLKKNNFC